MLNQNGIELGWIIRALRRWMWLIIICVLLAAAVAFLMTANLRPEYDATATLLVQPAQDSQLSEYNSLITGERLAMTYTEMLKGPSVLNKVISQYQLGETAGDLAKRVTAQPVKNTQLIRLTVNGASPIEVVTLANAIGRAFIENITTIQTERYADPLKNLQDKMEELSSQIEDTQADTQALTLQKTSDEAKQAQLESNLANYRSSYQQLQQEYQNLQLNLASLTNGVGIAETARPSKAAPFTTAVVTFLVPQALAGSMSEGNYSAETYGRLLTSRSVLEAAVTKLGLDLDPNLLEDRIEVTPIPSTQLIQLSVADTKVEQARKLADTIAEVFISQMEALNEKPYNERISSLQAQIHEAELKIGDTQLELGSLADDQVKVGTEIAKLDDQLNAYRSDYRAMQQELNNMQLIVKNAGDAVVISEPATAANEVSKRRSMYIALAVLVCAMVTCGGALVLEYLNDVIRTREDISQAVNLSTLGEISLLKEPESGPQALTQPRSPAAETFRILATNLHMTSLDRPLRTILVTSPHAREGKTLVLANLAAVFAQRELRVIAVDADLRMPRLHNYFHVERKKGLTDALLDGQGSGPLKPVGIEGLRVLTSGDIPPNPAEVVASGRMRKLIELLVQDADLVLIDCPPVIPITDAAILASIVDGVVVVVHAQRTRRQELRDAVENLRKVDANLLGVVLNGVPNRKPSYYKYYGSEDRDKLTGQQWWKNPKETLARLTGGKIQG